MVYFHPRIRLPTGYNPFYPVLNNPLHDLKPKLSQTLKMAATEANSKRPVCPSCSKPAWLCLCSRIRTPGLENSVRVTILQHSLERKHPLNSARIARLGLKNLTVATVSDVHFESRLVIWLRESNTDMGLAQNGLDGLDFDQAVENGETQKLDSEPSDGVGLGRENMGTLEPGLFAKCPSEKNTNLVTACGECSLRNDLSGKPSTQNHEEGINFVPNSGLSVSDVEPEDGLTVEDCISEKGIFDLDGQPNTRMVSAASTLNEAVLDNETDDASESEFSQLDVDPVEAVRGSHEAPVITATIGKYGVISSLCHIWMPEKSQLQKPTFDKILSSPAARDALGKGFSVKKLQKRQMSESMELEEEYEEFELGVPPGSVLLFPSDCAIGVDGLDALGFEVTNLIVLDGTWAKATRMYNENPWLKLLPHLKLDLNKMSLFGEVRSQPKAGCLSTIESIIYALKAIGDEPEGLDNLLDVFESMVEDQRRCKDERLSKVSSV
jgi:DTW domain-containing protein YfiP